MLADHGAGSQFRSEFWHPSGLRRNADGPQKDPTNRESRRAQIRTSRKRRKADARIRTGDPFITRESDLSPGVPCRALNTERFCLQHPGGDWLGQSDAAHIRPTNPRRRAETAPTTRLGKPGAYRSVALMGSSALATRGLTALSLCAGWRSRDIADRVIGTRQFRAGQASIRRSSNLSRHRLRRTRHGQ
jgi:hypothetical protein